LPYPGGPVIEKLAKDVDFTDFFNYPRGQNDTLNFSFSGLKTAVLYDLAKRGAYDLKARKFLKPDDLKLQQEVASSLLVCVKDIFQNKIKLALKMYPQVKAVSFVGGVACNKYLKTELANLCKQKNIQFFTPSAPYCTDNAAMISFVGYYKAKQGLFDDYYLDVL